MGAVAAKREREKLAQEKSYKDVMEKYYGKLTELYGRPDATERQIQQVMQEYNVDRLEAIRRIAEAQYSPRAISAEDVARIRSDPYGLFGGGGGGGGMEGFSVVGKRPG